jgi:hypothetical protein
VSWRLYAWNRSGVAAAALIILALGNVLSLWASSPWTMAGPRFVAGLGSGLATGLMAAALTNMPAAERRFGLYMIVSLVVAGALSWISGWVLRGYDVRAMFATLAVIALLPLPLSGMFPALRAPPAAKHAGGSRSRLAAATGAILLGTAVYWLAAGGTWAFAGRLGIQRGLDAATVGALLGIALLCGAGGACVPFVLRSRAGFLRPLLAAATLSVASVTTLALTRSEASYATALGGFMFAWIAAFPYLMALCSRFDPLGRLGALCYGVSSAAAGAGPVLAGIIIEQFGAPQLLRAAAVGIAAGTALLVAAVPFRPVDVYAVENAHGT